MGIKCHKLGAIFVAKQIRKKPAGMKTTPDLSKFDIGIPIAGDERSEVVQEWSRLHPMGRIDHWGIERYWSRSRAEAGQKWVSFFQPDFEIQLDISTYMDTMIDR